MVRTSHLPRQYPDPGRITAIAASIALNAALFMFLMQPPAVSAPVDVPDTPSMGIDIHRKPPVDPPKPPPVVRKVQPQPKNTMQQVTKIPILRDPPPRVISQDPSPMGTAVVVPPKNDLGPISVDLGPPKTVEMGLVPIASPAPAYPLEAARDNITGTVQLELLVGVDGHVLQVRVVHSSGDRRLDNAAREEVLKFWRFQPATQNGVPVQALGDLPVAFTLSNQ